MCGPIITLVSLCVDQWEDCFMLSNLQLSVARSVLTLMAGSVKPCSTDAGRFFCRTGGAGGTGWPVHLEKHSLSRNDGKIGSSSKAFTAGWGMVRWRLVSSVLFFSRPRSEGWPHRGRTSPFVSVLCHSDWLFHGESCWCCPSRLCMVFLACMHLLLFLALSLSPGNSLVSSWCDHSMLASLLWQCLTVLSLCQLVKNPLICFLWCPRNSPNLSRSFHLWWVCVNICVCVSV